MDKSYVTLAVCPICKEDTGTLLLDRRLKPTFEMHTMTPEPCDKCREQYLSKGVLLLEQDTGSLCVLKDEAFTRIFDKPIPSKKIAFVEQGLLAKLNLL
jgi:uncharacterized protein YbaR (Trm112 family)